MDFDKFDARGKAEVGQAFPILHPEHGTPLVEGDKEAKFIVRGSAAPSVQAASREALKRALQSTEEDPTHDFGWYHEKTVDAAMQLLVGFENVELRGVPVTMDNAREFLDLVFPRVVKDSETGALKVANKTFAAQVIQRSQELDELLGNV